MTTHSPQAEQLEAIISKTVMSLEEGGALIIDPASVAYTVDLQIDPKKVSPALKTYASIMEIRNQTRKYLARRHDPVTKAKDAIEGTADLFSDQLQPWYPVNRDEQRVYAALETLSREEVDRAAARMKKAGSALIAHADALIAWDRSRTQYG